jgi:4-hydroxy-2-oxoglutarate aldolase
MMVGAAGAIVAVANAVPEVCVTLYDLVRAGRHDEARALQRRLTPLAVAVTGTYGVAGLKATMEMAGYVGGTPRGPLRPVKPEAREILKRLYDELVSAS